MSSTHGSPLSNPPSNRHVSNRQMAPAAHFLDAVSSVQLSLQTAVTVPSSHMKSPVGVYGDRIGARWPLLAGAVCGICAMCIPFFFRQIPALFACSLLLGVSFTLYNVLLPNVVGLVSRREEHARNFSNASLVGSITMFYGPLVAGIAIDLWGHAAAFLVLALLSVAVAVPVVVWGGVLPAGSHAALIT